MTVRPLPYKTWIAPFYSHSERYGDTPLAQHAGNAIMLAENQGDPDGLRRDLERVYPLATPLIVQGDNAYDDKFINLTVAWWAAGANADELGASVTAMLTRPEKPIVAYLDKGTADDWPAARPAWVTDRVWPSAQAYRNPGESLLMFEARVTAMLERLASYGVYLGLTPAFFDRNGTVPVAEILECMPLYDKWLRNYPIVVFQPFADRRPGGMSTHAELKSWAQAFNNANYARPNRFDYWLSAGTDINTVLKNKLGQTVALVSLSPTEKKYLLGLMDTPPIDPPIDPPASGLIAPNMVEKVKQALRELTDVNPLDEVQRAKIIDRACVLTGDARWGRKARNADGTNKNTDGMCYRRVDGKHEVYDALRGSDPDASNLDRGRFATWDGYGPFNPGENGYWAPHE